MTWTTAISDGSGNFALWLEIVGFGVFGSVKHTPTDSWCNQYSTEGRVYPWMEWDSIDGWREEIDFLEASLKVTGISPRIIDVDGGMTALFSHYRGGAYTRLSQALTAAATVVYVDNTADFDSSGLIWIGQECIKYSSKSAGSFNSVTRGYLGTKAVAHSYDVDVLPPIRPVVGDNASVLPGRRAYLHFASFSHLTGTYSATEVIYRGRVKKGTKVRGGVYEIPIEHISEGLRQKIGRGLGAAALKPNECRYSSTNQSKRGLGTISIFGVTSTVNVDVTITTGTYDNGTLLREVKRAWEAAFASYTSESWYPWIDETGEKPAIRTNTSAAHTFNIAIGKYDPLWFLGFEEGPQSRYLHYEGANIEASEDPRIYMAETGGEFQMLTEGRREPDKITTTLAYVPGEKNVLLRVEDTGEATVTVGATDASWPVNVGRGGGVIECKSKGDLLLRECFQLSGRIDQIIRQCYALSDAPIAFPAKYAASGLLTSDFDFSELTDAYDHQPWSVVNNYHLVTKEVEVQKLVAPTLSIMGVCPRLTDSAKIGFASFIAPTELEANDVEVDSDVWANIDAAMIASVMNSTPLINAITVGINKDFQKKDEPGDRITCFNVDGLNELGESKQLNYDSMIKSSNASRVEDVAERINEIFTTFHFPIFGRESVTVEIPCNWKSKQIKCGDLVKITHELIYDTPRGALGVTDALGLVVGRRTAITNGNDILRVRIFTGNPWKGVAPTAKATSYNTTAAYMTVSSTDLYCAPGDSDLDAFNQTYNVNVRLYPYDASGTISYLATVTSVDTATKRVYFSSAPLTWGQWTTTGFWIVMAEWGSRTSSAADGYAYIADNGSPPSIGASSAQYHRWGP